MAIPVLLYVTSAAQGLPVIAAVMSGGRRPPVPHMRLAIMGAVLVLGDAIGVLIGAIQGNNLWTQWYMLPLELVMTFWVLAAWHPSERARHNYLVTTCVTLLLFAFTMSALPNRDTAFEQWIAPVIALVALVGVVQHLVTQSIGSMQPLVHQDWFWVCLGLALFWLMQVPIAPFAFGLLSSNMDWVVIAYLTRAWIILGAFVLIAWGILCPRVLARSLSPS